MCQRLENYLGIYSNGTVAPPPSLEPAERTEYEDDENDENVAAFEPFKDLCKRRFLWYYESYMNSIELVKKRFKVGQVFKRMPFEGHGNGMDGNFNYPELKRRLELIRSVLDDETARWALEGELQVQREYSFAAQLHRQAAQLVEHYGKNDAVTLDLALPDPANPFVWQLGLFGRPMTQLDGGIFRIRIHISPRFPDEQPRVRLIPALFHHRVAKDGTLCYVPRKPDELQSHIDAIVTTIEEERPPYDPRTLVNLEASALFWGSEADKKTYNKRLRRAVQRTLED